MNLTKLSLKIGLICIFAIVVIGYSLKPVYAWRITNVDIEPSYPTDQNPVKITVSGEWGNPCFEITSSSTLYGNTIKIDVTIVQLPVICATVIAPWEITAFVGPLNIGGYFVEVNLNDGLEDFYSYFSVARATPFIDITLNETSFNAGDTLIATAHVSSGSTPANIEVKIWAELPGGELISIHNIHNYPVPAYADYDIEVYRHTFTGNEPPGEYKFSVRSINPINGSNISADIETFDFTP